MHHMISRRTVVVLPLLAGPRSTQPDLRWPRRSQAPGQTRADAYPPIDDGQGVFLSDVDVGRDFPVVIDLLAKRSGGIADPRSVATQDGIGQLTRRITHLRIVQIHLGVGADLSRGRRLYPDKGGGDLAGN